MRKYIKLSQEEAQTLRSLGYDQLFGWCPYNGLVLDANRVDSSILSATVTLLECGSESRRNISSTFVGDYMSDVEGVFDCPDSIPGLRDALSA